MKENKPEMPTQIELKKKRIVCPNCKVEIEVDLTIDITPITELIGAFGAMQSSEDTEESDDS